MCHWQRLPVAHAYQLCHCEEHSDVAIPIAVEQRVGSNRRVLQPHRDCHVAMLPRNDRVGMREPPVQ